MNGAPLAGIIPHGRLVWAEECLADARRMTAIGAKRSLGLAEQDGRSTQSCHLPPDNSGHNVLSPNAAMAPEDCAQQR